MQALLLLVLNPNHILSFSQELANRDQQAITRVAFLQGLFDCAIEIHGPGIVEINNVADTVRNFRGVKEVSLCTLLHSWASFSQER